MTGQEPSSTSLSSSTHFDPSPPLTVFGLPRQDFPCLPSNPNPSPPPLTPKPSSSQAVPDSEHYIPSLNTWEKPPNLGLPKTRKFTLRFIPPTSRGNDLVGICPSESVAGELQILDLTLVGFFLGRKPGFTVVRTNLLKQWKLRGSVQVLHLVQGGFAFRFSNLEDRDQILEVGVFYVSGQPILFQSWERNIYSGGILGLKEIPLWVSLPGLPLHLWGEESLSAICSVLGKPLYSDRITAEKSRWSFARVCVEFSGASPLLDSIIIEDDVGNVFQQPVKYDWKPPQCTSCGIFGHIQDSCKQDFSGAERENEHDTREAKEAQYAAKSLNLNRPKDTSPRQGSEEESSETEKSMGKNPNQDLLNRGKEKTFSDLLQKRTSNLLQSWNPIRVKKTGPAVLDPTRNRRPLHNLQHDSDLNQNSDHVSASGAISSGPLPCLLDKGGQAKNLYSNPYQETSSNDTLPAHLDLPLTNKFEILGLDQDSNPCTQSAVASNLVSGNEISVGLDLGPICCSTAGPGDGLHNALNHSSHTVGPKSCVAIGPDKENSPPFTPAPSQNPINPLPGPSNQIPEPAPTFSDPKPSFKGRNPYPPKSSILTRSMHKSVVSSNSQSRQKIKPPPPPQNESDKLMIQPTLETRIDGRIGDDRIVRTSDLNDPMRILFC